MVRFSLLCAVGFSLLASGVQSSFAASDLSYTGDMKTIQATEDDTLIYLARDHNLGYVELVAANPQVDPWLPGQGTDIILPARHLLPDAPQEGVVINLAEMRLYAYLTPGQPPITFPLGIGRDGLETPQGQTSIVRKVKGPVWFPTQRMREENPNLPAEIGPGKSNPLGTHALYLGWPEYLIHGTNRPFGIGRRVSSGCMRMYPEDIVRLYTLIPEGSQVNVVSQDMKAGWIDNQLFIEVHPNADQSYAIEEHEEVPFVAPSKEQKEFIKKIAGESRISDINWDAVNQEFKERSGYPVVIIKGDKEQGLPMQSKQDAENAAANEGLDHNLENGVEQTPVPESKRAAKRSSFNS